MFRHAFTTCLVAGMFCASPVFTGFAAETETSDTFYRQTVQPFLGNYCLDCHSGDDAEAELALDRFQTAQSLATAPGSWETVLRMVRDREMPPEDMDQPKPEEAAAVVDWIEETLRTQAYQGKPNPGRVTLRRLNRVEYGNTIRDLLGVEFDALERLPADDVGYGFDNIGDVLSLPPLLMEKYLDAAEEIAAQVFEAEQKRPLKERYLLIAEANNRVTEAQAARQILTRFVSRAFRRPATEDELRRYFELGATVRGEGGDPQAAVEVVVAAVLCSPHFLFKVERDPEGSDPEAIRTLDEYELATRLSYFLWSSMPDDELLAQARVNRLRKNLDSQVRRMLVHRNSRALVDNFAGQWFQLRNLEMTSPDKKLFPQFDQKLRDAMGVETLRFFAHVMRENRSVLELVDADYTFLNEPLARFYGIENVKGDEFRRVSLADSPRGGVVTQASVLTLTSNPTRTSPVKRGKWVMENILGTPPPEPPADVPMLEDQKQLTGSLREQMEQHRADPNCAVCHRKMDQLGFALENFDAVGAWRTSDGEYPVNAAGELPDGRSFNGPAELKRLLKDTSADEFARCMAEKMLTYATGRGVEPFDRPAVDEIVGRLQQDDYRFATLVEAVTASDPFNKRSKR
jgi:mono/diheme cytochrome c family protein